MGLQYNGTNIYGIIYNGVSLTQLNFDGVPVWYALTACVISGVTRVGKTWKATTTPSEVQNLCTFQWYRGNTLISGATGATYVTTESDRGYQLKCIAKIGTASAESALSGTILQDVTKLGLSGVLEEGYTLSASITPSYATGTYQWYRGSNVISGANKSTYTLTHDDAGNKIKCVFTANGNWSGSVSDITSSNIVGWYYNSGTIANLSKSSNSDWFETDKYTPSSPIVPEKVYCYFSYNYYSKDDGSNNTSCGGGLLYTCADGTSSGTSGAPSAGAGISIAGRPSSGTASKTTTFTSSEITWLKQHGGLTQIWYNGGGGTTHGTQSCGGYIQGYWERR